MTCVIHIGSFRIRKGKFEFWRIGVKSKSITIWAVGWLITLSLMGRSVQAIGIGYYDNYIVISYTATETQNFENSWVAQNIDETMRYTQIEIYNDVFWDQTEWHIALDNYGGSEVTRLLDWDTFTGINWPFRTYTTLEPGWMPPGVQDIHQHWSSHPIAVKHVEVPEGGGVAGGVAVRLHVYANAVPTVVIDEDWTGGWALNKEILFAATGQDTEADMWSTCYLEYRWDFDEDGVWDTSWSTSNQASHTFTAVGPSSVSVQVIDRGYSSGMTYNPPFEGEMATYTVSNNVVPEPATLLLFGLGGLALRRKHRAK